MIKHAEIKKAYYNDPDNVVVQYLRTAHGATCFMDCDGEPLWHNDTTYRIKPKTINIGKYVIAAPYKDEILPEASYYIPCIHSNGVEAIRVERMTAIVYKNMGLLHCDAKSAILHGEAIILASGGVVPS